jgi:methionyl-tRNA formyltransferase
MFAILFRAKRLMGRIFNFSSLSFGIGDLCSKHRIPLFQCRTPNDALFVQWIKENDIDVLLVKVGHILKKDILAAPKYGIINKHASILPANKGHFPYLYAYLKDEPQGYSLHQVTEKIDSGGLLCQKIISFDSSLTMLGFYTQVFIDFPNELNNAVDRMIKREFMKSGADIAPSYNKLPGKKEAKLFAAKAGRVWRFPDIIRAARL